MNWCGHCFSNNITDFESDEDAYEYINNNNRYIFTRKSRRVTKDQSSTKDFSAMSTTFTWEDNSSKSSPPDPSSRRSKDHDIPNCSGEDEETQTSSSTTSICSSKLERARVWHVGHATIDYSQNSQTHAPTSSTANDSDRSGEKRSTLTNPSVSSTTEGQSNKNYSQNTFTFSSLSKDEKSVQARTRQGFFNRLFRWPQKSVFPQATEESKRGTSFKRAMDQSVPSSIATNTLYWTVKVPSKRS